jgi:hypothetical protein
VTNVFDKPISETLDDLDEQYGKVRADMFEILTYIYAVHNFKPGYKAQLI